MGRSQSVLVLLWGLLVLVELQTVQELGNSQDQAAQAAYAQEDQLQAQQRERQRLDALGERTAQQVRDEGILAADQRRQARRNARARAEYDDYINRKAKKLRHHSGPGLGEANRARAVPVPPPENQPAQRWDSNAPAPNDAEVNSDDLPDQDNAPPSPPRPEARSAPGPPPPAVAQVDQSVDRTSRDPDEGSSPDPQAAAAWAQASTTANTGGRNDVESYPSPTNNFVNKFFAEKNQIIRVREPRYPQAAPDPVNAEKYQNATVMAHDGGQLNPNDAIAPPAQQIPGRPDLSGITGTPALTTSVSNNAEQPIVRDDVEDEQMAPAVEADKPDPAPPTVPAAKMAEIQDEANEFFKQHTESLVSHPGKNNTKYQEAEQKTIARYGILKASMIRERKTKYITAKTIEARTNRERKHKGAILKENGEKTTSEVRGKAKRTSVERQAKKIQQAEVAERTAKERATKPTEAELAKQDELEEKADHKKREELAKEQDLQIKAAHDAERKRETQLQKEKVEKTHAADEKREKDQSKPTLGEILAKDAYLASIHSSSKRTSGDLKEIATNLEMKVQHGLGTID